MPHGMSCSDAKLEPSSAVPQWVLLSSSAATLKTLVRNGQCNVTCAVLRCVLTYPELERRLSELLVPLLEMSHLGSEWLKKLYTKAGGRAARTGAKRQASPHCTTDKFSKSHVWAILLASPPRTMLGM